MRDRLAEFHDRGADVLAVTFTDEANLAGYFERFSHPIPVVSDRSRTLYRALGFGRGSVWRVWGIRAAVKYVQLLRRGHKLERVDEDTLQLGGNAIIDRDGRLVWRHAGAGPDDRPSVDALLAAIPTSQGSP